MDQTSPRTTRPGSGFQLSCIRALSSSLILTAGVRARGLWAQGGGWLGSVGPARPCHVPPLPQAPCSALTWLRTPRRPPRVPRPWPLSQASQSSRGPGAPLPLLQAWTSPWMEPIRTSLTQTWLLLPSSVCGRPPAPGTGASRWCVTHILCGAWVGWGPARAELLPDGAVPAMPCLLYRALLAGVSELAWWAWGAVGTWRSH